MRKLPELLSQRFAILLVTSLSVVPVTFAADQEAKVDVGKVAGILIVKNDTWITVKADGEAEPVKYLVDPSDKKLQETFKSTFNACRVQLTYRKAGDVRHLVTLKKQMQKITGTVTGDVVKVYDNFWVEVKPKVGVADAYAPGVDNFNDKDFMDQLKGLKPGDSVTIAFYSDIERHRIKTLRVNPAKGPQTTPPANETTEPKSH